GGTDNDLYILDPGSVITLTDDGGVDTLNLNEMQTGVTAAIGSVSGLVQETLNPNSQINIVATIENIIGTPQNDVLIATNTLDASLIQQFIGGAGDDTFIDQSSADQLVLNGGAVAGSGITGGGSDTYTLDPIHSVSIADDGGTDTINL